MESSPVRYAHIEWVGAKPTHPVRALCKKLKTCAENRGRAPWQLHRRWLHRRRLPEPSKWEVSLRGARLADYHSLKTAFSTVEHHRRETLRQHDLAFWFCVLALDIVAAFASEATGILALTLLLAVVLYVSVSGIVRIYAILGRSLSAGISFSQRQNAGAS